MTMRVPLIALFVLLALGADAAAQQSWIYRARAIAEVGRLDVRGTSRTSGLLIAAADGTWEQGRWKLAGGFVAADASDGPASFVAREGYARLSAASWVDLEAGKRLLRWGVGYGFAPAGVLDPPRDATDPTDRFGRLEGQPLARADFYAGPATISVAAARSGGATLGAMRANAVLAGGFEVSLIAAIPEGRRASFGGNLTHVIGQRLAWHAEVLSHESATADARAVSGVAGLQYTQSGINFVLEYHRRERDDAVFARAARAGADIRVMPELIVMRSIDRGGWTSVGGVSVRVTDRFNLHARALRSAAANSLSAGTTVRF